LGDTLEIFERFPKEQIQSFVRLFAINKVAEVLNPFVTPDISYHCAEIQELLSSKRFCVGGVLLDDDTVEAWNRPVYIQVIPKPYVILHIHISVLLQQWLQLLR
jgi:hypothetical protein